MGYEGQESGTGRKGRKGSKGSRVHLGSRNGRAGSPRGSPLNLHQARGFYDAEILETGTQKLFLISTFLKHRHR